MRTSASISSPSDTISWRVDVVADRQLARRDDALGLVADVEQDLVLVDLTTVPWTIWPSSTSTIVPSMASAKEHAEIVGDDLAGGVRCPPRRRCRCRGGGWWRGGAVVRVSDKDGSAFRSSGTGMRVPRTAIGTAREVATRRVTEGRSALVDGYQRRRPTRNSGVSRSAGRRRMRPGSTDHWSIAPSRPGAATSRRSSRGVKQRVHRSTSRRRAGLVADLGALVVARRRRRRSRRVLEVAHLEVGARTPTPRAARRAAAPGPCRRARAVAVHRRPAAHQPEGALAQADGGVELGVERQRPGVGRSNVRPRVRPPRRGRRSAG